MHPFPSTHRRARTPDPPSPFTAADTDPSLPHLPLPNKQRHAFAMIRHGSDDHHERRRESKLGFAGLSGLAHSHTIGHGRRRPRPEHGAPVPPLPQHSLQEPSKDVDQASVQDEGRQGHEEEERDCNREHGLDPHALLRREDDPKDNTRLMHHKFASEGWPAEDEHGSKLGRRISTLRGGHGMSSWRNMRKQVSAAANAAANAAAHSMRAPEIPYLAGGGRHPMKSTSGRSASSTYAPSIAPSTKTVMYTPGGGRCPAKYPASLAPSRPHSPQEPHSAPPPLPPLPSTHRRPSFGRSASYTSACNSDTLSTNAHHKAPSIAHSVSTVSDGGSEPGNLFSTGRTGSARHHTLSHVRNSTSSIHHYQPSEGSLTSSPGSAISPLSPVTPKTPYGPGVGGSSPGKRSGMSRTFRQPNIDEVLPFASSPFAAWDPVAIDAEASGNVKSSSAPQNSRSLPSSAGWRNLPRPAKGVPGSRRVWQDAKGKEVHAVYKVGWECEVLDLEGRLHETMYELAGGRHSFADGEPATVLDLGTGTGLWPISAALQWRQARIIGADLVPCYVDLHALATAETRARTSTAGEAEGVGLWASVAARVEFQQFNFLEGLPYDSGVFDMVHIRFAGLGVPETRWAELLDEAVRVLRPGGVLEIIEMSCEPPPSAPASVTNSFASQLLSDFIPQNPVLALQLHLPATAALIQASTKPVFQASWVVAATDRELEKEALLTDEDDASYFGSGSLQAPSSIGLTVPAPDSPPQAIVDAGPTWIRSVLGYRGTGLGALKDSGIGARAIKEFATREPERWGARCDLPEEQDTPRTPASGGRISLAAWVAVKS